jgi:hypothetical protein
MPTPPIESRVEIKSRVPAVISVSAVIVAAVHAHVVDAVRIVGARIVGVATARYISALYVAAAPSMGHDASAVVFAHNRAAAVDAMIDLHSIAIDRSN